MKRNENDYYNFYNKDLVNQNIEFSNEISLTEFDIPQERKMFSKNVIISWSDKNKDTHLYAMTYQIGSGLIRELGNVYVDFDESEIIRSQKVIWWSEIDDTLRNNIKKVIKSEILKFDYIYKIKEHLRYDYQENLYKIEYTISGVKRKEFDVEEGV